MPDFCCFCSLNQFYAVKKPTSTPQKKPCQCAAIAGKAVLCSTLPTLTLPQWSPETTLLVPDSLISHYSSQTLRSSPTEKHLLLMVSQWSNTSKLPPHKCSLATSWPRCLWEPHRSPRTGALSFLHSPLSYCTLRQVQSLHATETTSFSVPNTHLL